VDSRQNFQNKRVWAEWSCFKYDTFADKSQLTGALERRKWQNNTMTDKATIAESKVNAPVSVLWWILVTGLLGFFGAAMLTYEHIRQLLNPNESLSCDVNSLISCGTVMKQDQAHIFGFPNSWVGIVGFSLVIAFAVAQLFFRRSYSKKVWVGFVAGLGLAATFVTFLFSQSMFVIHVLCPYCMVVWAGVIPLFIHILLWSRSFGIFDLKPAAIDRAKAIFEWSWVIAVGFELAVFAAVYLSFIDAFRAI